LGWRNSPIDVQTRTEGTWSWRVLPNSGLDGTDRELKTRTYDIRILGNVGATRRWLAAWLVALALLSNFLAAGELLAHPAEAQPSLIGPDSDFVVVCTSAGKVVLDRNGLPVPAPAGGSGHEHGPHCVFCLPLMQGVAWLAPPAAFVAPRCALPTVPIASFRAGAPSLFRVCALWARGPPQI
jgi:hypothetical protein